MLRYIDFHTHRQRRSETHIEEIISIDPSQPRDSRQFTLGHHPWWAEKILDSTQIGVLKSTYINNSNCLGIGEFGLDKLKGKSMDVQMEIAGQHLELAAELGSPVIIHCVRAYHQMLELKKEYKKVDNWVIHGYARHALLAKMLLDAGFLLSVMPNIRSGTTFIEMVKYLPLDSFVLETDSYPDLLIEEVYNTCAEIKGISIEDLSHQMEFNVRSFFPRWTV